MEVKTYSKLKLYAALREQGLWDALKDWLVSNGWYDPFVLAQELRSDHPMFAPALQAAQEALGVSGDLVMQILEASEVTEG